MAAKKLYSDEELRARKNKRARERYQETKGERKEYFAKWHATKQQDPEYRERMRLKAAQYRLDHPEKTKEHNRKRRETKPEETKKYAKEWFEKNRDKKNIYQQNRRKRAIQNGGKLSADISARLFMLQRGLCACCRADLKNVKQNIDHIMPLAMGGKHEDENVQLLCSTCNNQKHAKHPVDFMRERGFLL